MKARSAPAVVASQRPSAVIRRAVALGIPVSVLARECDVDAQALYRNARTTPATIKRLESYLDSIERAA